MARPKDQSARRRQLIDATLTTLARVGLGDLTMKAVAHEAGISARLMAYYFATREELVEAAHQAAAQRYYIQRRELLGNDFTPSDQLAHLMHSGLPRGKDVLLSQALDEISVSASRSSLHAELIADLFRREVSLYAQVLHAGANTGEFELTGGVETLASGFVLLEDALGLHLLAHHPTFSLERAEEQLSCFAHSATGRNIRPVAPA